VGYYRPQWDISAETAILELVPKRNNHFTIPISVRCNKENVRTLSRKNKSEFLIWCYDLKAASGLTSFSESGARL
jgi:hypothetical protein